MTGMPTAMNKVSEKLTAVEDFAPWSSPASASAPPLGEAPVKLAWRSASADRSTPGPLPYQMPNTPSTVARGKVVQLLGAPDRRRGEVLVEAWAEDDVVLLELRRRAPQLDVVAPERRAAITGNVPAGVEARRRIAQALLNGQAHQRLRPGHVDPALGRGIAGVESRLRPGEGDGHDNIPPCFGSTAHAPLRGSPLRRTR